MQLLKVLLVVLLVANLSAGFFFKKKKVYVNHAAPAHAYHPPPPPVHHYQPYPEPLAVGPGYASYYNQPVVVAEGYNYHAAPTYSVEAPPPAPVYTSAVYPPPVPVPAPSFSAPVPVPVTVFDRPHEPCNSYQQPLQDIKPPAARTPLYTVPVPVVVKPPDVRPIEAKPVQGLPVFEPVNFGQLPARPAESFNILPSIGTEFQPSFSKTSAQATASAVANSFEIVPSVGFKSGSSTDFIEIVKSQDRSYELPPETVRIENVAGIGEAVSSAAFQASQESQIPIVPVLQLDVRSSNSVEASAEASSASSSSSSSGASASAQSVVELGSLSPRLSVLADEAAAAEPIVLDTVGFTESPVFSAVLDDAPLREAGVAEQVDSVSLLSSSVVAAPLGRIPSSIGQTVEFSAEPRIRPAPSSAAASVATVDVEDESTNAQLINQNVNLPLSDLGTDRDLNQNAIFPLSDSGTDGDLDPINFPEVQELLSELLSGQQKQDDARRKKHIASGDSLHTYKAVEIDPRVSYSRVARQ